MTRCDVKITRSSGDVFRDVGFSREESEYLLVRADLLIQLQKKLESRACIAFAARSCLERATFFSGFDPVAVAPSLNFRRDARLGLASEFQDARVIRLQAKFTF